MFDAVLHGKLSKEIEEMEDILTSCVFGCLKYLDDQYLISFINEAISYNDLKVSEKYVIKKIERIDFWPMLSSSISKKSEPDLMIYGKTDTGLKVNILIEAKFKSGKSSFPDNTPVPNDQLAREYDNLTLYSEKEGITKYFLIYLTKDITPPYNDIKISAEEYKRKRNKEMNIYWLNWQSLIPLIKNERNILLKDLKNLLLKLGLISFEGIPLNQIKTYSSWSFQSNLQMFSWKYDFEILPLSYFFSKSGMSFKWNQACKIEFNYKFRS